MDTLVLSGYMKALGGSIVAGRDFTWDDTHGRRPVAMVSATLARELWGGPTQAICKRVRPYAKGLWREVVKGSYSTAQLALALPTTGGCLVEDPGRDHALQ